MNHRGSALSTSRNRTLAAVSLGCLALLFGLAWMLWPRAVRLDDEGYQVARALYQVCNRRDSERLAALEFQIGTLKQDRADDTAVSELQRILELAKTQRWDDAMKATRTILAQQVESVANSR